MMNNQSAFKLGLATFVMVVAIAALLIWKSGLLIRATGYELVGVFTEVAGLLEGAEVRYRGYSVGNVSKMIPKQDGVYVHFWVKPHVKVPKGSLVKIMFDGLIGERFVAIAPNTDSTEMVKPRTVLEGAASAGLADFIDVGTQNLEQSREILRSLREIVQSNDVNNAIRNTFLGAEKITQDLGAVVEELRRFADTTKTGELIESITAVAKSLRKTTDVLLEEGNLGQNIADASKDLATMSANLNKISSDLHEMVVREEMFEKLNVTLTNIADFTTELNALLKDEDLKTAVVGAFNESQGMFQKSGKFFNTVASIDIVTDLGVKKYFLRDSVNYELSWDFWLKDKFLRLGFGDFLDTLKTLHIQHGIQFTNFLTGRVGLFYREPGVAIDFHPIRRVRLSSEFYNLNDPNLDLLARLGLFSKVHLTFGLNNVLSDTVENYTVGISVNTN